jgi:hypothetical protein
MEAIKQLKELFDEGLMTKEEYDERRLQVINEMTLTEYDGGAAPQQPKEEILLSDDGGGDRWGSGGSHCFFFRVLPSVWH